jgi:uncharacterized repeat protein (TIGR01451 family)
MMLHSKRQQLRIVALIMSSIAMSSVMAQVVTTCPAALETTQLFPYSGAPATFTVPANVDSIRIIAVGADGGERSAVNFASGAGARAEGTFAVTPGQVLTVIAGEAPPGANDFEAGGGGASGAYLGATLAVIAGGGGGDDNTGNGGGGVATQDGGNGGSPATNTCTAGGLGGIGGNGGQFGEIPPPANCETGEGGAGGGGINGPGGSSAVQTATRSGPRGGAACSILGAAGGAGGFGGASGGGQGDGIGARGGFGVCGGGGADNRESGGGGGYSGGGGGPESALPGGGGSFVAGSATTPTLTAGASGGGSGRNGSVRLCYTTRADLSITKTNTPALGPSDQPADTVVSGSAVSYSIVAVNNGGASANGTVITDPAPTGLTCATATCTAAGGATCPAATGAALVGALQGAGAVVPTLPVGGSVTMTLSCTAN